MNESLLKIPVSVGLAPEEWYYATWRDLEIPLRRKSLALKDIIAQHKWRKRKPPKGNDLRQLLGIFEDFYGRQLLPDDATIDREVVLAETHAVCKNDLTELATMLGVDRPAPSRAFASLLWQMTQLFKERAMFVFTHLAQADNALAFMLEHVDIVQPKELGMMNFDDRFYLVPGIAPYLIPSLSRESYDRARRTLKERLPTLEWADEWRKVPHMDFFVAAALGLHEELEKIVEGWPDGNYPGKYGHFVQAIVFGLGNKDRVASEMRRTGLHLLEPWHISGWLAHTETSDLDFVVESIGKASSKEDATRLIRVLARADAPEVAPAMLKLMHSSKAPALAREWLDAHPVSTTLGLAPMIGKHDTMSRAALEQLRRLKRHNQREVMLACLPHIDQAHREHLQGLVIDFEEKAYVVMDSASMPEKLAFFFSDLREQGKKAARLPAWLRLRDLPPVVVGGQKLADEDMALVLAALKLSEIQRPHPLIPVLYDYADKDALEELALTLLETWLTAGAPASGKWTLISVSILGRDRSAEHLAGLIKTWPQVGQHKRAILGLHCLVWIGTNVALGKVEEIAKTTKFKGLKREAKDLLKQLK